MIRVLIAAALLAASGPPALAQASSEINCARYDAMNATGQMAAVELDAQQHVRGGQDGFQQRRHVVRSHFQQRDGQESRCELQGSPDHDGPGRHEERDVELRRPAGPLHARASRPPSRLRAGAAPRNRSPR